MVVLGQAGHEPTRRRQIADRSENEWRWIPVPEAQESWHWAAVKFQKAKNRAWHVNEWENIPHSRWPAS
jgi:hypothetical protein